MAIGPLHEFSKEKWETIKKVTYEEKLRVYDLKTYLKLTDKNDIIIRTSLVVGGWHDNEFDANRAGFAIYRFLNPDEQAKHNFAEYYHLIRR